MNKHTIRPQAQTLTVPTRLGQNNQDDGAFRSIDSPLLRKHGFGLRQRIGKGDIDIDGIRKQSMERLHQLSK